MGSYPVVCSVQAYCHGEALQRAAIRLGFLSACKVLGLARLRTLTIHHGRHTFISHALAGGRTLAEVRIAAGHTKFAVTSIYLHGAVDDDEGVGDLFGPNRLSPRTPCSRRVATQATRSANMPASHQSGTRRRLFPNISPLVGVRCEAGPTAHRSLPRSECDAGPRSRGRPPCSGLRHGAGQKERSRAAEWSAGADGRKVSVADRKALMTREGPRITTTTREPIVRRRAQSRRNPSAVLVGVQNLGAGPTANAHSVPCLRPSADRFHRAGCDAAPGRAASAGTRQDTTHFPIVPV